MMPRLRSFLFSIQTKLVLAMTAVIVLAILLAGTVFVARSRNERKDAALNRIVAASPATATRRSGSCGATALTSRSWTS